MYEHGGICSGTRNPCGFPKTKAIPHNGASAFAERFCPKGKCGKSGNTGCISLFSHCTIGAKDSAKAAVSTQRCCLRSSLRSCCLRVRNGSVLFCVFMLLTPFKRGASVGFSEPSDKKANTGKTALDCDFCNT